VAVKEANQTKRNRTMKAIVNLLMKKSWVMLFVFSGIYLTACNQEATEERISQDAETSAIDEAELDAVFEDVDDIAVLSVSSIGSESGGKIAEGPDSRFCGTITFEGDKTAGTIIIDFGNGCEDAYGNVRTGKIIIKYNGGRLIPGSTVETTLQNYSINDIAIEGVRTLENVSDSLEDYPTFHITLVGGKVTWTDETFATREVDRTRVWVNAANPINDEQHIVGTASGMTRRGVNYDMIITDTLVFKRNCAIGRRGRLPVSGTKVITTDNKVITIDFGDGACDRIIEVTVEGNSEEVTVD